MSVVMAACGIFCRTSSRMARNFLVRYDLRISLSTLSEPDCSGMCNWGHTVGVSAMASITSEVNSAG